MSRETTPNSVSHDVSTDAVGAARLLMHIKENNVTWMLGVLIAHQMGLLDKFITYGSGMC
jgi:hypothetical protein